VSDDNKLRYLRYLNALNKLYGGDLKIISNDFNEREHELVLSKVKEPLKMSEMIMVNESSR